MKQRNKVEFGPPGAFIVKQTTKNLFELFLCAINEENERKILKFTILRTSEGYKFKVFMKI